MPRRKHVGPTLLVAGNYCHVVLPIRMAVTGGAGKPTGIMNWTVVQARLLARQGALVPDAIET